MAAIFPPKLGVSLFFCERSSRSLACCVFSVQSMSGDMAGLVSRLEAVTTRLETLAAKRGAAGGGGDVGGGEGK